MNDAVLTPKGNLREKGKAIRDLAIEKMLMEVDSYTMDKNKGVVVEKSGDDMKVTLEDGKESHVYTLDNANVDDGTGFNSSDNLLTEDLLVEDGLFGWIPDKLAKFEAKGINECEELERGLEKVRLMYGGEGISGSNSSLIGELRDVQSRTEHWSGAAATNFESYFVNAFETAAETQKYILDELIGGVRSMKNLKEETEKSAYEIANETYSALSRYPSGSGDGTAVALSILGAVLAIGSLAAAQPEGVALVMGLMTLASTAANTAKTTADNVTIEGTCVFEIVDSMSGSLSELETRADGEISTLATCMRTSVDNVNAALGSKNDVKKTVLPLRPNLTDESPSVGEFSPPGT